MTAISKIVLVLVAAPGLMLGQHFGFGFGFGVKGGVPVTDLVGTTGDFTDLGSLRRSNDYLVGPAAEFRIPFGLAVEGDAIYRGAEYAFTSPNPAAPVNGSSWEFPYLAKFRFPIPLLKPFIVGGGAYRTFTDLPSNISPAHNAFVLGAGLELRLSKLRLSGEMRWLRWGDSSTTSGVRPTENQGELLFGVMF